MSVSGILLIVMGVLYACGVFLVLERSMTRVLIGFLLLGNATNILIMIVAGPSGAPPILGGRAGTAEMLDPLPQAMSLTAIVITFGLSAFLLALIYRSWYLSRIDEVQRDPEDVAVAERLESVDEEGSEPDTIAATDFVDETDAPAEDRGGRS